MVDDIGNKYLEKRLARIERWFKRCVAACKCGSWSSALMEIECMEAETKGFRDDLWRVAEENSAARHRKSFASSCLYCTRVAVVALVIVLSAVFPLSVDSDGPARGWTYDSAMLLSSTEAEIITALRENLSSANMGRVVVTVEMPEKAAEESQVKPALRGAALAAEAPSVAAAPARDEPSEHASDANPGRDEGADIGPSVEDVISLIQVGQRALGVSEPAIKVVK
ncbi:MAG: hypothetical protein LBQ58_05025 [Synergistaceae bacterium]|nr:hypothetical protein [Synergistaceae bacterium]